MGVGSWGGSFARATPRISHSRSSRRSSNSNRNKSHNKTVVQKYGDKIAEQIIVEPLADTSNHRLWNDYPELEVSSNDSTEEVCQNIIDRLCGTEKSRAYMNDEDRPEWEKTLTAQDKLNNPMWKEKEKVKTIQEVWESTMKRMCDNHKILEQMWDEEESLKTTSIVDVMRPWQMQCNLQYQKYLQDMQEAYQSIECGKLPWWGKILKWFKSLI